MKLIFALLFVSVLTIGVSADFKQELQANAAQCARENKANVQDMLQVASGGQTDDHNTKCAYSCLLTKYGMIKGGKIDGQKIRDAHLEKAAAANQQKQVIEIIDNCLGQVSDSDDTCDDAYQLFVCLPFKVRTA